MRCELRQPAIELFLDDAGRNRATYWLPELLLRGHTDDGRLVTFPNVVWRRRGSTWEYSCQDTRGRWALSGRVSQKAWGWTTALSIRNLGNRAWHNVVAATCLSLVGAPDFVDGSRLRTFQRTGGCLVNLARDIAGVEYGPHLISYCASAQELDRSERHRKKWEIAREPSDDGIIGVASSTGYAMTVTWESVSHLQSNTTGAFRCIHANPAFGSVGPGQSKTVRGLVVVHLGEVSSAWSETLRRSTGR